jgi:hypothetical protein
MGQAWNDIAGGGGETGTDARNDVVGNDLGDIGDDMLTVLVVAIAGAVLCSALVCESTQVGGTSR